MENDKYELSEEMEILIAKRLLGEISKDENVKLEIFLQDNPEIKKSYFEKEGVKRLLVNAADNLEELQLPADKRNVLFNKFSSKNSGKFILYTYVAAASVFFAFMIGIYFYADKKLQDPETSSALKSKEIAKEDKDDEEKSVANERRLNEKSVPQLDEVIVEGKDGKSEFGKKMKADSLAKSKAGELQDLEKDLNEQEEVGEIKEHKQIEKLIENNKQEKPAEPNYEQGVKSKPGAKDEKRIVSAPPAASGVPLKEESAKLKEESKKSVPAEKKSNQNGVAESDKLSKKDSARAEDLKSRGEVENIIKEAEDGSLKDKQYSGGGSLDQAEAKRKEPIKSESDLKGELGNVAAVQAQQFEYKSEFKFNESNYKIQFTSSVDLANAEKAKKLTLRQFLEFSDEKDQFVEGRANMKGGAPKINIRVSKSQSKSMEEKQKEPEVPAKAAESKSAQVVALSTEVALLYECYGQYEKRDALTPEAKKKFLSELKTTLLHLTYFKDDPDLKTWVANIEKELK